MQLAPYVIEPAKLIVFSWPYGLGGLRSCARLLSDCAKVASWLAGLVLISIDVRKKLGTVPTDALIYVRSEMTERKNRYEKYQLIFDFGDVGLMGISGYCSYSICSLLSPDKTAVIALLVAAGVPIIVTVLFDFYAQRVFFANVRHGRGVISGWVPILGEFEFQKSDREKIVGRTCMALRVATMISIGFLAGVLKWL